MRPAHERLEGDDRLAVGRDNRLVMQQELVVGDGLAQIVLDRLAHADGLVHLPLEDAVAVAPLAFRFVEGGVGEPHEGLAVAPVLRREGDADGDAHRDRRLADIEWPRHAVENAPRQELGRFRVAQPGLDDGEFVAAEPRQRVAFAEQVLQALRRQLEEPVAGLVAEGVVDVLEAVEIEEQDRKPGIGAREPVQLLVETLRKQETVRQSGQRVAPEQVLGRLFAGGEAAGDPADVEHEEGDEDDCQSRSEDRQRHEASAHHIAGAVGLPSEIGADLAMGVIERHPDPVRAGRPRRQGQAAHGMQIGERLHVLPGELLIGDRDGPLDRNRLFRRTARVQRQRRDGVGADPVADEAVDSELVLRHGRPVGRVCAALSPGEIGARGDDDVLNEGTYPVIGLVAGEKFVGQVRRDDEGPAELEILLRALREQPEQKLRGRLMLDQVRDGGTGHQMLEAGAQVAEPLLDGRYHLQTLALCSRLVGAVARPDDGGDQRRQDPRKQDRRRPSQPRQQHSIRMAGGGARHTPGTDRNRADYGLPSFRSR